MRPVWVLSGEGLAWRVAKVKLIDADPGGITGACRRDLFLADPADQGREEPEQLVK